jgi:hypothetical protein
MALRKFTEEQVTRAKKLHAEGFTFAEIGRRMGMIEQSARYLALRREVPIKLVGKKKEEEPAEEGVEYFRHDRYYF